MRSWSCSDRDMVVYLVKGGPNGQASSTKGVQFKHGVMFAQSGTFAVCPGLSLTI